MTMSLKYFNQGIEAYLTVSVCVCVRACVRVCECMRKSMWSTVLCLRTCAMDEYMFVVADVVQQKLNTDLLVSVCVHG